MDLNAQDYSAFESAVLGGSGVDLLAAKRGEAIKTAEEIRQEWLQKRRGKFTASEFYRLMTYPGKNELSSGAKAYVLEKAVETMTVMDDSEGFINAEMQWGIDHELDAISAFTAKTGEIVTCTGIKQTFLTLGDYAGGTPDGLIGHHAGVEVKCPKSKTHFGYLSIQTAEDLKAAEQKYYWQIMGCMMITGFDYWYFISYDPRFLDANKRLHFVKIERNDEDIGMLGIRLAAAISCKKQILRNRA